MIIVGISSKRADRPRLFFETPDGTASEMRVSALNAYLIPGDNVLVEGRRSNMSGLPEIDRGNSPTDGGHLLLAPSELPSLQLGEAEAKAFIRPFVGSNELIHGINRFCIWIEDQEVVRAKGIPSLAERIEEVRRFRLKSTKAATVGAAGWPHRFDERKPLPKGPIICVPITSSENREYLPAGVFPPETVVSNLAFAMPADELWTFGIIVSKMMMVWVATVCSRLELRLRFTNTAGWNTFPVEPLTEKNKADLTRCAEDILLARETHFPATIAEMYDPDRMDSDFPDLRAAHERNDEVLERIYIGRRFRNDTERLEKLFELYTKMTAGAAAGKKRKARASA